MNKASYIERKPNSEKYRIVDKGVTVEFLVQFINDAEWTIEQICENYNLTPAEIYSAWAFYYDHKDEIDQRIAKTQTDDDKYREESQQQHDELRLRHKKDN